MATYKANARGHDGKKIREVGEVFEFEGKKGSWMDKIEPAKTDDKKVDDKTKQGK